jgi:hypothetical protein
MSKRFRPQFEPLESRYAPAGTLVGNTVTCVGADTVELRIAGATTSVWDTDRLLGTMTLLGTTTATNLTVNGDPAGATDLFVNDSAFTGGDNYAISDTAVTRAGVGYVANFNNVQTLSLLTGPGRDNITITNRFGQLGGLPRIIVDGGAGVDTLTLSDATWGGGDHYKITDTTVSLPCSLGVIVSSYQNIDRLTLITGSGNDQVCIESTSAATSVLTGAGNDVINIGNAAKRLDDIRNPIFVDGGPGFDTLNVIDAGFPGPETYTPAPATPPNDALWVGRLGPLVPIVYTSIEWFALFPAPLYVINYYLQNPPYVWDVSPGPPPGCDCDLLSLDAQPDLRMAATPAVNQVAGDQFQPDTVLKQSNAPLSEPQVSDVGLSDVLTQVIKKPRNSSRPLAEHLALLSAEDLL